MEKVAIFFADGYEEIEALTVVDILRRAEISIDMVSVTGNMQVTGSHHISVAMDKCFSEVNFEELSMLILPGGAKGVTGLEAYEPLMKKVEEFYHAGKPIAAICAAPSILGHRGFLKGRRACSYPTFESQLEEANVVSNQSVVVDEHVITSRGMGCSVDFALEVLKFFRGEEAAKQMAEKIVYQM